MPADAALKPYVSYADYVALEARSDAKHEWLDGVVYDMAGGTPRHAALTMAVGISVGVELGGKPCRVFSSDLKVRIPATGLATYPDLTIVCGKLETSPDDPNAVTNPTLIVEVLSDATEAYDRGEKFGHYRRLDSLREYVLVSQRSKRIEVWRKNDRGKWELAEDAGAGERATLMSIGSTLDVDAVYADPLAPSA